MREKPTVEGIKGLLEQRKDYYAALRKQQTEDEGFYEGTNDIGVKSPYRVTRFMMARGQVDVTVDHIVPDHPAVKREPRKPTQEEQRKADLIEKFLNGWLIELCNESPHPIKALVKMLCLRGEGWGKTLYDDDAAQRIADEPKKRKGEKKEAFEARHLAWQADTANMVPFLMSFPDPMGIYASPRLRNGRPLNVIETYERLPSDVQESWPDWEPKSGRTERETVTWIEWWEDDWRCFLADDKPVLKGDVQPNIYGFVPYRYGNAGYGIRTHTGAPEQLVRSCFHELKEVFVAQDRRASQIDSIVALWAFHRMITDLPTDQAKKLIELDWTAGSVITLPEGALANNRFRIEQGESPPPGLFAAMEMIQRRIDMSFPAVVRGATQAGVDTGYQQAIMTGQARLRFKGPLMAAEGMLAGMVADGLRLLETVHKKPITIYAVSAEGKARQAQVVRPEDIGGYYNCQVKLEASDPEENDRRQMLGLKLKQGGAPMSWQHVLENYFGVANATEIITEAIAEDIVRTNPAIVQGISKRALEKLGLKEELAWLEEQEKARAGGPAAPLGPGTTQPPGVPPRPARPGSFEAADLAIRQQQRLGAPGGIAPLESPPERVR